MERLCPVHGCWRRAARVAVEISPGGRLLLAPLFFPAFHGIVLPWLREYQGDVCASASGFSDGILAESPARADVAPAAVPLCFKENAPLLGGRVYCGWLLYRVHNIAESPLVSI